MEKVASMASKRLSSSRGREQVNEERGGLNYESLEMGLGIKEIVVEIHSEKWR